ncbi:hypothetical protein GQ457_01G003990 [Hibiscus cannabinus]
MKQMVKFEIEWTPSTVVSTLASSVTEPWSLIGDFNATLLNRDRKGCSSLSHDYAFQHMVFDCGLHDLDYSGPDYTWYRGNCSARLDRCFGNSAWFEKLPTSVLHYLLRMKSDHRPLLLSPSLMTPPSQPPPELESLLDYEEQLWKQKSRLDWINLGDRNTKYFHSKAIARRRRQTISKLKLGSDDWCDNDDQLRSAATAYFSDLFTITGPPPIPFPVSNCIPALDADTSNSLARIPLDDWSTSNKFSQGAMNH